MATNIELTAPLGFLLLHELQTPGSGTDLAQRIGERKGSGVLTPGTIYPALKDLHRKKLVSYRSQGRKKVYSLTQKGEDELEELYEEFEQLFAGLGEKIEGL